VRESGVIGCRHGPDSRARPCLLFASVGVREHGTSEAAGDAYIGLQATRNGSWKTTRVLDADSSAIFFFFPRWAASGVRGLRTDSPEIAVRSLVQEPHDREIRDALPGIRIAERTPSVSRSEREAQSTGLDGRRPMVGKRTVSPARRAKTCTDASRVARLFDN